MAENETQKRPPRVNEQGSTVCTWLPATYHDKLIKLAREQDRSVSQVVRQLVVTQLD